MNDPEIYGTGGACFAASSTDRRSWGRTGRQYDFRYGPDGIAASEWNALVINELCGPAPDAGL